MLNLLIRIPSGINAFVNDLILNLYFVLMRCCALYTIFLNAGQLSQVGWEEHRSSLAAKLQRLTSDPPAAFDVCERWRAIEVSTCGEKSVSAALALGFCTQLVVQPVTAYKCQASPSSPVSFSASREVGRRPLLLLLFFFPPFCSPPR